MKYLFLFLLSSITAFSQLPKYSVTMTSSDYQLLFTRDVFSDSLIPASFEYQGNYWNDAQIRFKGHSTRYYPKKSYRVKFSKTHLFENMQSINFNAMYTDKSFLREKLAWDIFEKLNALAPHAHHSIFSINGKEGLYLFIEKVDKYFLQNRNLIIAPMYEANDTYINADLTIQPDSLLKLYYDKEIGKTNDYSDLAQLINAINFASDNTFRDTLNKYFDMQSVFNWFTGNILTMMEDSYNKNYLLYRDTSKVNQQWTIIPWDYDLSFGRDGDPSIPYPASLLNEGFAYTFPPLSGPSNVLKDRFMADSILWNELKLYVDSVLNSVFTEEYLYPKIDSLVSVIKDYVYLDEQKWGTLQDFYDHAEALKYFITARKNYLKKTFINSPSGEYNQATLPVHQVGVPYHFVAYDGRQIATLWFKEFQGLDSILVRVYPDSVPPGIINQDAENYIKRWVEVIPYPSTARFAAKFQWMYNDLYTFYTEVGDGVQDERLLRCYVYNGSSWKNLPSHVNYFGNFVTIDSISENECGVGKHFALMIPETYTQKWFRQPLNYWQRWYDIKFVDSLTGFIVGEHGTILKTIDGGNTWQETYVGSALPLRTICYVSSENILAAGDNGFVYQSTNLGENWERINIGTTQNIRGIRFSTETDVWIYGENGLLLHTTDGGKNWRTSLPDSLPNISGISIQSPAGNQLIVYLEDGTYLRSIDNGSTWTTGTLGTTHKINSVIEKDFHHWIVGDSGTVIYYRANNEWMNVNVPSPITVRDIYVKNETTLYAAGDNGKIFYTTNGGTDWFSQYTADSHNLYSIEFINDTLGFAVGSGGTILKTYSSGTVTAIKYNTVTIPTQFQTYPNYPNPFNPTTIISYDLPSRARVKIDVYNLLGQVVETVIDGIQEPGHKKILWDGSNLPSGVYFYVISVIDKDKNFYNVQKMILLK